MKDTEDTEDTGDTEDTEDMKTIFLRHPGLLPPGAIGTKGTVVVKVSAGRAMSSSFGHWTLSCFRRRWLIWFR